jgi:leucyl aminopeptidase
MLFSAIEHLNKRKEADLIVFPFWQRTKKNKNHAIPAAYLNAYESVFNPVLESGDFEGNEGDTILLYTSEGKESRCLLLGLGKEENLSVEVLRRAYSNVAKECQKKAVRKLNLVVPTVSELRMVTAEECLKGISEGILLTNYRWEKLVSLDEETVLLKSVSLIGITSRLLNVVNESEHLAEGVYLARDLINGNADIVTPCYLGDIALQIAQKFPSVKAQIFDSKKIEKEQLGLLLAVSRGASVDPAFIIMSYKGVPNSKDHTVLVGKGVTFDTGGLNLKQHASMQSMRDDMSGAAAVIATVAVSAALNLKANITAVVPATENAIDAKSYKPGDVYKSYAGTTVEIIDTDAEGRLILADALAYSVAKLKPTRLIDIATLTGSIVIALGEGMSGLFCNDEMLAGQLLEASSRTSENLWRMPIFAPYKEHLKSDVADIKNVGGKWGGSINAAIFLQQFVHKTPWAHIDIAGTAFAPKERSYWPKNGVGFGVRLLIDFLQNLSKKN